MNILYLICIPEQEYSFMKDIICTIDYFLFCISTHFHQANSAIVFLFIF